jgi:hypothetical protein
MRLTVMHIKRFTDAEVARLNGPDGGWDSEPRFSRYADATMNADEAAIRAVWEAGEYDVIADLEVAGLEDAFRASNSFDRNWTENEEVTSYSGDGKERSTSVGDILANPDTGEYYFVAPFGFEKIEF